MSIILRAEDGGNGRTRLPLRLLAILTALGLVATVIGCGLLLRLQDRFVDLGTNHTPGGIGQLVRYLATGLAILNAVIVAVLLWCWIASFRVERRWRQQRSRLDAAVHGVSADFDAWVRESTVELAAANDALRDKTEALAREVAARRAADAEVWRQSHHGRLTGLVDRPALLEAIEQAIARAHAGDRGCAVFVLELDDAGELNDALGQHGRDILLTEVTERLVHILRTTDAAALLDMNRFAVMSTDMGDPGHAVKMAEALIATARGPLMIAGNDIDPTVSLGIALCDPDVPGGEALLSNASEAMTQAKARGHNSYCFFTDKMSVGLRDQVALIAELREAIASSKQFFLLYQPQVEIETGKIVGLEALIRWDHPLRGLLPPSRFLPAAEAAGFMAALDRWTWREASVQCKAWLDAGLPTVVTSVNVTGAYISRAQELEEEIAAVLAASQLPPSHFEIEVSEPVLMKASDTQMDALAQLRLRGIRLTIDDLGAGSSSFRHLRRYAADRVTIAQELVRTIDFDPVSAAMVKSMIGLCRDLGIVTSAKGVRTAQQLHMLRAWGCREAQGFLFAKPLAADDVASLLRHGVIDISERLAEASAA